MDFNESGDSYEIDNLNNFYSNDDDEDNFDFDSLRDSSNNDSETLRFQQILKPITVLLPNTIGGILAKRPLRVLLDSGSNICLIHRDALPKDCKVKTINCLSVNTVHGVVKLHEAVTLQQYSFPEFSPTQRIDMPVGSDIQCQTHKL